MPRHAHLPEDADQDGVEDVAVRVGDAGEIVVKLRIRTAARPDGVEDPGSLGFLAAVSG